MTRRLLWRLAGYAAGTLGFFTFFLPIVLVITLIVEEMRHESEHASARAQPAEFNAEGSAPRTGREQAVSQKVQTQPPDSSDAHTRKVSLQLPSATDMDSSQIEWAIIKHSILVPPVPPHLIREAYFEGDRRVRAAPAPGSPAWEAELAQQISRVPAVPLPDIPQDHRDQLTEVLQEQLAWIPLLGPSASIPPQDSVSHTRQPSIDLASADHMQAGSGEQHQDDASNEAKHHEQAVGEAVSTRSDTAGSPPTNAIEQISEIPRCDQPCSEPSSVGSIGPMDEDTGGAALDPAIPESLARQFAINYLEHWSSNEAATLHSLARMYGPIVHFHGKRLTREQLLLEKRRAVQRWPEREYKSRPSTVVASCVAATRCTVRSVYDYRVAHPETGRTAKGTEQLRLRVSLAGGAPVIVQEESGPVSVATGLPLTRSESPRHNARGNQTQKAPQANSTASESSLRTGRAGASSRKDQAKQHTSKSEHSPEKGSWEKRPIVKLKDPDPVPGAKASRAKLRRLQAADRASTRMSSRGTTRFIQSTIEIAEPEALFPFGPGLIDVPPGSILEHEEFELP